MPRLPPERVRAIEHAEEVEDDETLDKLLAEERRERAELEMAPGWEEDVESRLSDVLAREGRRRKDASDRKTVDEVFDRQTLLTLYKLISSGLFETLDYPVSTGKEANVFHASTKEGGSLAVKIFRTNTATFRSFMTYISGDPRFASVRPNRRDIVHAWCQKEYKNLQRMREHAIRVPNPVAYLHNVLVMEFIGTAGTPAPRLRDKAPSDPKAAYGTLLAIMRKTWTEAGLVHGDFSEFNVLNLDDEMVVIDVAQAVLKRHPMARELLERDVRNFSRHFRKYGIQTDEAALVLALAPPRAPEDRAKR
ncbi:MAG TPA: serine protein kinase RIO [Candidatus Thermoplasmatota archaeon]|nr:serine protein kinase RIO [Candidatus Thermoplasmatota archaeon]